VRVAVPPEFKVTTKLLPDRTDSLAVAEIATVWPALYEPLAVDDEKLTMVGATVSTVMVLPLALVNLGPVSDGDVADVAPFAANVGRTVPSDVQSAVAV